MIRHGVHATLARRQQLGNATDKIFGRVDGEGLKRLVQRAINGLGNHLGLADIELKPFAAHVLHQDRQRQFASALHFPSIRATRVDNFQ